MNSTFSTCKSILEDGLDTLDNLNGFIGELSSKFDLNHKAVTSQVTTVAAPLVAMKGSLLQVETKLSAMLELVKDALKVYI